MAVIHCRSRSYDCMMDDQLLRESTDRDTDPVVRVSNWLCSRMVMLQLSFFCPSISISNRLILNYAEKYQAETGIPVQRYNSSLY